MSATTAEAASTSGHRPLLLSLRPRFADAILDGIKSVELRRTRMGVPDGTLVLLYASAPVMAVVGLATVAQQDVDSPDRIWRRHRRDLGLSCGEFYTYLEGADQATALTLKDARRLQTAVGLHLLRSEAPFNPPQSYRFLKPDDPVALRNLAHNAPEMRPI
ncbi:hypothetical protein [Amycolatopsis sp. YIM 10]|uniref:hypothetical protein n=1 Tax=Amycolatopsis sp. YIM 10 TaxID=2653857 RepID=UPI00129021DA|nr:hypothetical protein [Amycolatopsis sp. YIM 10]